MAPYIDYRHDILANMLEQADAQILHQRRVMDDMQDRINKLRKDNEELRYEVAAWRGR